MTSSRVLPPGELRHVTTTPGFQQLISDKRPDRGGANQVVDALLLPPREPNVLPVEVLGNIIGRMSGEQVPHYARELESLWSKNVMPLAQGVVKGGVFLSATERTTYALWVALPPPERVLDDSYAPPHGLEAQIRFHQLDSWWQQLPAAIRAGILTLPSHGSGAFTSVRAPQFLSNLAAAAYRSGHTAAGDAITRALWEQPDLGLLDRFRYLQQAAFRAKRKNSSGEAERLLRQAIELVPDVLVLEGDTPRSRHVLFGPFETFAKLLERERRYRDALAVCQHAVDLRIRDPSDWADRISRLEKRLQQS